MKLRPVALAAAVLLGGCGGGDPYAAEVCTALDRWVQSVNGSLAELRDGTEDRDSVSQELRAVIQHLEDVETANAGLRQDLGGTGTSLQEEQLTDRLVALLDEADRAVREIREEVEALETQRLQELRETVGPLLGNRLGRVIRRVLGAPAQAGVDLAPAFEDETACDEILLPAGGEGGGPA